MFVRMKGWKNVIYMALALGMLIYAVPQLPMGGGMTAATWFAVIWVVMALLIVAAHLHDILGVDAETRRELARIKHQKRWQTEQALLRGVKLLRK